MNGVRRRCAPDYTERYLRRLAWWAPRRCRHDLVMEARRHLYEATRRAEQAGLTRERAQREAVRAFGPAWRIGLAARGIFDNPLCSAVKPIVAFGAHVRKLRRAIMAGRRPHRRPRLRIF